MFSDFAFRIFEASIDKYHEEDRVDQPRPNPYEPGSIEYLLYLKKLDRHGAMALRRPDPRPGIDPEAALELKRKIDASNRSARTLWSTSTAIS